MTDTILVIREPAKRIPVVTRQLQRVAVRLLGGRGQPGPQGEQGLRGEIGLTGPPSIYVSETPPSDPVLNPLWLNIT